MLDNISLLCCFRLFPFLALSPILPYGKVPSKSSQDRDWDPKPQVAIDPNNAYLTTMKYCDTVFPKLCNRKCQELRPKPALHSICKQHAVMSDDLY